MSPEWVRCENGVAGRRSAGNPVSAQGPGRRSILRLPGVWNRLRASRVGGAGEPGRGVANTLASEGEVGRIGPVAVVPEARRAARPRGDRNGLLAGALPVAPCAAERRPSSRGRSPTVRRERLKPIPNGGKGAVRCISPQTRGNIDGPFRSVSPEKDPLPERGHLPHRSPTLSDGLGVVTRVS